MAADILTPPADTDEPATIHDDFDYTQLDPANLMRGVVGDVTEIPAPVAGDVDDALMASLGKQVMEDVAPAAVAPTPAAPADLPPGKPEPVNMKNLRLAREAAERERDTFRTERDELTKKLNDLEPRARNYEAEKQALETKLAEQQAAYREAQERIYRSDAREHPEWKAKADDINSVAKEIEAIVGLPEIREAGLQVTAHMILNPSMPQALNAAVQALVDAGRGADAQKLVIKQEKVLEMRGELRKIESRETERTKTWQENSEVATAGALQATKAELAAANPVFDARSAQYQALPKEQQDFLNEQLSAAEVFAREMVSISSKPEALLARAYRMELSLRLAQRGAQGVQATVTAQAQEIASLKAQVAAYERAAGGGSAPIGGGSPTQRASDPTDPADEARSLDPKNLPGYNGLRG